MMIENKPIKLIALIGFVSTIILGEPVLTIIVALTIIFYIMRPSAYLGLLFISGPIKFVPLIQASPVDITLLSYFLFIGYFLFQRIKNPTVNKNILVIWSILGVCFATVLSSLLTTPAPWNYVSKSGVFIVALYLPLVFMVVQLSPEQIKKNIQGLFQVTMLIGYAWLGLALHHDLTGYSPIPTISDYRFSAFGEDYMLFSLFAIPLVLEALIAFLFKEKYVLNGILLFVLAFCMLNSPARGLTINLVLASIFIGIIFLYKPTSKKLITVFSIFTALILGTLVYVRYFITAKHDAAIQRLSNFDLSGTSVNNRFTSIKVAWEQWKDHIFFGTGTDSVAFFNNDPGLYTHNVVLEAIFEYGLIGAIPLMALVLTSLICFNTFTKNLLVERSLSSRQSIIAEESGNLLQKIWFTGMFIVLFLFSMTSGTLGTMRPFWIFLALSIATEVSGTIYPVNNKSQKANQSST